MTDQANGPAENGGDEGGEGREKIVRAVQGLQAGEDVEANSRVLFESYYHPLQRFFLRKGFSQEDALDLTQDTMLGIYKGVRDFRHEARFETWLYRVATTTYLKRLRTGSAVKRSGVETSYDEMTPAQEPPAPTQNQLENVLDDEQRRKMREAIEELPEKMRKCLILRIDRELSYRDIATVMRLKINTVKAHLFQAKEKLREKLNVDSLEDLDHDAEHPPNDDRRRGPEGDVD